MELNVKRDSPLPVHIYFKDNPELLVSINKRYTELGLTFEPMSAPRAYGRGVLLEVKTVAQRSFLRDIDALNSDDMIREIVLMTLDDYVINTHQLQTGCDLIHLYEVVLEQSMDIYLNKTLRIGVKVEEEVET